MGVELFASSRLLDMFLRADLEAFICVPSLRQKAVSVALVPLSVFPSVLLAGPGRHTRVPWQSSASLCETVLGKDEREALHLLPFLVSQKILKLPYISCLVALPLYQIQITITLEEILTRKSFGMSSNRKRLNSLIH